MGNTENRLANIFSGILVICAITITGFVIRQEFFPPEPQPEIKQIEDWQKLELNGQRTGPENAPVQIIEIFDYQCPYCKSVQPAVQAIQQKYSNDVSVTYEHFPLSGHNFAFDAAVAAECAGKQESFQSYHDLLFANQNSLGYLRYDSLATEAGVEDIESFTSCLENQKMGIIIESGRELGEQLGIDAIPTFLINGKMISGALSEKMLDEFVQEALAETK